MTKDTMFKDKVYKRLAWGVLVIAIYAIIQGLINVGVIDMFYEIIVMRIAIDILLALGLDLIIGLAGQFSLGHAGFMSIGAYSCAIVTLRMPSLVGFAIGIVVGILVSAVAALIIAIPTLRLKGDYLAIATLGFAEIIRMVMVNAEKLTNGAAGLSGIPRLANWTLIFIAIVLTIILLANYIRSSPGRATVAIREDEIAAEAMGINTTKYKTTAFIIGAMIASVAGAFYATTFSVIKPENFAFNKSVDILIIAVFGGLGSVTGTILAAVILGLVNMFLQDYGAIRMLLYAGILVLIMIFRPQGLMGTKEFTMTRLFNFFGKNKKESKGE